MRANAIEAAEQCGILTLPEIAEPVALTRVIAEHDPAARLIFCDEDAEVANPVAALGAAAPRAPLAVLVGPEGGFAEDERAALLKLPNVVRLALGPAFCAPTPRPSRRWRSFRRCWAIGADASGHCGRVRSECKPERESVNDPRLVDADEADVVAVAAIHAGHVRQATPRAQ